MSSITNKHKTALQRFLANSPEHQAAVAAGLASYPAVPVCNGGFTGHHRRVSTGRCIECSRASVLRDKANQKAKAEARATYAIQVAAQVAAQRALTK